MTPKEKALDLFRRFVIKHNRMSENEYTLSRSIPELKKQLFNTEYFAPKEMTLMCVDEILKQFDGLHKPEYCAFDAIGERKFTFQGEYAEHMTGYDMVEYWKAVRSEIQAF